MILASGSPIRSTLLSNAGVDHVVRPVKVDEVSIREALLAEGAPPRDIADTLAEMKAQKAANAAPDAYVLGCDQVLNHKGTVLGKATDRAEAAAHIAALSGDTHSLLSAVVLYHEAKPIWRHVGVVRLTMRPMTGDAIDRYLDHAWPDVADCVGCYKLEGRGAQLFTNISGDYFTVLGLPLLPVISILQEHGQIEI
ncbi:MAG: Maf family nucleotide pyrophosphatase [Pseudomonadota bacterium]